MILPILKQHPNHEVAMVGKRTLNIVPNPIVLSKAIVLSNNATNGNAQSICTPRISIYVP